MSIIERGEPGYIPPEDKDKEETLKKPPEETVYKGRKISTSSEKSEDNIESDIKPSSTSSSDTETSKTESLTKRDWSQIKKETSAKLDELLMKDPKDWTEKDHKLFKSFFEDVRDIEKSELRGGDSPFMDNILKILEDGIEGTVLKYTEDQIPKDLGKAIEGMEKKYTETADELQTLVTEYDQCEVGSDRAVELMKDMKKLVGDLTKLTNNTATAMDMKRHVAEKESAKVAIIKNARDIVSSEEPIKGEVIFRDVETATKLKDELIELKDQYEEVSGQLKNLLEEFDEAKEGSDIGELGEGIKQKVEEIKDLSNQIATADDMMKRLDNVREPLQEALAAWKEGEPLEMKFTGEVQPYTDIIGGLDDEIDVAEEDLKSASDELQTLVKEYDSWEEGSTKTKLMEEMVKVAAKMKSHSDVLATYQDMKWRDGIFKAVLEEALGAREKGEPLKLHFSGQIQEYQEISPDLEEDISYTEDDITQTSNELQTLVAKFDNCTVESDKAKVMREMVNVAIKMKESTNLLATLEDMKLKEVGQMLDNALAAREKSELKELQFDGEVQDYQFNEIPEDLIDELQDTQDSFKEVKDRLQALLTEYDTCRNEREKAEWRNKMIPLAAEGKRLSNAIATLEDMGQKLMDVLSGFMTRLGVSYGGGKVQAYSKDLIPAREDLEFDLKPKVTKYFQKLMDLKPLMDELNQCRTKEEMDAVKTKMSDKVEEITKLDDEIATINDQINYLEAKATASKMLEINKTDYEEIGTLSRNIKRHREDINNLKSTDRNLGFPFFFHF